MITSIIIERGRPLERTYGVVTNNSRITVLLNTEADNNTNKYLTSTATSCSTVNLINSTRNITDNAYRTTARVFHSRLSARPSRWNPPATNTQTESNKPALNIVGISLRAQAMAMSNTPITKPTIE